MTTDIREALERRGFKVGQIVWCTFQYGPWLEEPKSGWIVTFHDETFMLRGINQANMISQIRRLPEGEVYSVPKGFLDEWLAFHAALQKHNKSKNVREKIRKEHTHTFIEPIPPSKLQIANNRIALAERTDEQNLAFLHEKFPDGEVHLMHKLKFYPSLVHGARLHQMPTHEYIQWLGFKYHSLSKERSVPESWFVEELKQKYPYHRIPNWLYEYKVHVSNFAKQYGISPEEWLANHGMTTKFKFYSIETFETWSDEQLEEWIKKELELQFPDKVIRKALMVWLPPGVLIHAAKRRGLMKLEYLQAIGFDVVRLRDETRVKDDLLKRFPDKVIPTKLKQLDPDIYIAASRIANKKLLTISQLLISFGFTVRRETKNTSDGASRTGD